MAKPKTLVPVEVLPTSGHNVFKAEAVDYSKRDGGALSCCVQQFGLVIFPCNMYGSEAARRLVSGDVARATAGPRQGWEIEAAAGFDEKPGGLAEARSIEPEVRARVNFFEIDQEAGRTLASGRSLSQDGTELGVWRPTAGTDEAVFVADGDLGASVTDPTDADSDSDLLDDGVEDWNGNGVVDDWETNPDDEDTDGDGLEDGEEDADFDGEVGATETDPADVDSDDDGLVDGTDCTVSAQELTDLLVDNPTLVYTPSGSDFNLLGEGTGHNGYSATVAYDFDSDDDGDSDGREVSGWTVQIYREPTVEYVGSSYTVYSDPNNQDTDGDGLHDSEEHSALSDPDVEDTDGDGYNDDIDSAPTGIEGNAPVISEVELDPDIAYTTVISIGVGSLTYIQTVPNGWEITIKFKAVDDIGIDYTYISVDGKVSERDLEPDANGYYSCSVIVPYDLTSIGIGSWEAKVFAVDSNGNIAEGSQDITIADVVIQLLLDFGEAAFGWLANIVNWHEVLNLIKMYFELIDPKGIAEEIHNPTSGALNIIENLYYQ